MQLIRQFKLGAGALLLAVAAAFAAPAQAQNVTMAELLVEGPLGDIVLGNEDAPVTIFEFASMTCPHCATFHTQVFHDLKREYIDTGRVRFVMREFPLDVWAAAGFALARCAEDIAPGGYWTMIDVLFERQAEWAGNYPAFQRLALQSGFTQQTFEACIDNQALVEGIFWGYDRGVALGVTGTPTFFVNGEKVQGTISFRDLSAIIDRML